MNSIISKLNISLQKFPFIKKYINEEIIRFLVIGTSSFALFYFLNNSFLILAEAIIPSRSKVQRAIMVATSYLIAYILTFIYNFTSSKKWTFKIKSSENIRRQMIKFFSINTANALAGAIFVTILDALGIPPYISQIFFTAMQTIWTYLLYKYWVFI